MEFFAIIYLVINLIIVSVGSISYPVIVFNKASKLGLNPPTPFNLVRGVGFWAFIDNHSKKEEYQSLRPYLQIPKYIGVINLILGTFLLVCYWEVVKDFIYSYYNKRSLF